MRAESTGRSLLLLDELGTGTDPTEGSALGIALLRTLARGGPGGASLTVATTHHSALTSLKYEDEEEGAMAEYTYGVGAPAANRSALEPEGGGSSSGSGRSTGSGSGNAGPRFENASVEFDELAMAPTYRLLWGVPGRSNALNIAARLGLDPGVVAHARTLLGTEAERVEGVIAELEGMRGRCVRDEEATAAAEEAADALLVERARARRDAAAAVAEAQGRKAEAVTAVLRSARAELAQAAREWSANGSGGGSQQAVQASAAASQRGQLDAGWAPAAGDTVRVPRLGGRALKVVAIGSGGELTLQQGMMRVTARRDEVTPA